MPRYSDSLAAVIVVAAVGFVLSAAGSAESRSRSDADVLDRVIEMARNENQVMEHLDRLCQGIGARPAGSANHQKAAEWALERFQEFGLSNVHLEQCGEAPAHPNAEWAEGLLGSLARKVTSASGDETVERTMLPVYNVVGDIRGTEIPNEYVIVGAHYDSVPIGTGALDNGTGVAAALEAARILVASGAKPKRTIRFVLFAGEESGLIGSRGYIEAHPELLPRISAMYNMDLGTHYISGISATEPLKADLESIFAPAMSLHEDMPFEVEPVDWLLRGDPNCCLTGGAMANVGKEGGPVVLAHVFKKKPDGTLERMETVPEEFRMSADDGGSPMERVIVTGACDPGLLGGEPPSIEELEALGLIPEGGLDGVVGERKVVAIGSSDQSAFLAAGVPGFWWTQRGDSTVSYPAHSSEDTYDKVIPKYLEHSAAVIAVGALGTADLDYLLSRERLTEPLESKKVESIPLAAE